MMMDDGFRCRLPAASAKRKEPEDEGILNFPSRKVPKLDVGIPVIMEEDETLPLVYRHNLLKEQLNNVACDGLGRSENINPCPLTEERALILYKPYDDHSSTEADFPLKVGPDLIASLKSLAFRTGNPNQNTRKLEEKPEDETSLVSRNCLAIIPWVPSTSQTPAILSAIEEYGMTRGTLQEPKEAEEAGGHAPMEVEETGSAMESFRCQQQCVPQGLVWNNSNNMMWSW